MSGVKVSGVTIYRESDKKILAQYPVLISNTTHFDEFEKDMRKTGEILYKKVTECVEQDKVIDFEDLFSTSCKGNCACKCH